MNHPAPSISVVMTTFNKASYLERTLASWTHQTASGYELVIIDDGGTDDTPAVVERYAPRLPISYHRIAHAGRGPARNYGLERARGEIIAFSDDDRLVSAGFIQAYQQELASGANVVALGWQKKLVVELRPHEPIAASHLFKILDARPEVKQAALNDQPFATITAGEIERDLRSIDPFITDEAWFVKRSMAAMAMFGDDISACTLAWAFGTTGNMAVRRDALKRVGDFDPNFVGWGLEDTELHYRLAKAGATTRFTRNAVNYHQNHPRDDAALMLSWLKNLRYMFRKHPPLEVSIYMRLVNDTLTLGEADLLLRDLLEHGESRLVREYEHVLQSQLGELSPLPRS